MAKPDLDAFTVGAPKPQPQKEPAAAKPAPASKATPKKAASKPKQDEGEWVGAGLQMRPAARRTLRALKAETDKDQRDLLAEALNLLFKKYNKAQVA